jgi:VCBS repeat-containing protein
MNEIGTVQNLDGTFYVKDADGNLVELKNGDVITEGMVIIGDDSNPTTAKVEISSNSGEPIVLSGSGEQTLDATFLESYSNESEQVEESNEERTEEIANESEETTENTEINEEVQANDDSFEATENGSEQVTSEDALDTEDGVDDGQSVSDNLLENDVLEVSGESDDSAEIEEPVQSDSNGYNIDGDLEYDLTTTDGADIITIGDDVEDGATISTGDGPDIVTVGDSVEDESTIDTGDGPDTVNVYDDVEDGSTITTGDGPDEVNIGDNLEDGATIITGDGPDEVTVNDLDEGSNIDLGDGPDTLTVEGDVDEDTGTITGGSGTDTLILNSQTQEDWLDGMNEQFDSFENVTFSDGTTMNLVDAGSTSTVSGDAVLTKITVDGVDYDVDADNTQIDLPHGTLTVSPNGDFTYNVDNENSEVQALNIDDSLNETFTYTLSNGEQSSTANVNITIDGRDDSPVIDSIVANNKSIHTIDGLLDIDGDGEADNVSPEEFLAYDGTNDPIRYDEDNGNISINMGEVESSMSVEYNGGSAGYKNILGFYEKDENGNIEDVKIIYVDKGDMDGDRSNYDDFSDAPESLGTLNGLTGDVGFFIIPNGYSDADVRDAINKGYDVSIDENNNVVFTNPVTNSIVVADKTFYTDNDMSTDGRDHAVITVNPDGGLTIGMEDLPESSSDQDYDDVVFTIKPCVTINEDNTILNNITISDVDDTYLEGASVALVNYKDGDSISADNLPDGITATIVGASVELSGSATLADYELALESLTFDSSSEDRSPREFIFTVFDGDKHSQAQSISVDIGGCSLNTNTVNYIPEAQDDTGISTQEDSTIVISSESLLLNDFDANGNSLNIVEVNSIESTHGTISLNENGDVVYIPELNYNGFASFTYTVSDGEFNDSATVTINVESINDIPEVTIQSVATVQEDGSLTIKSDKFSISDVEDGSIVPTLNANNGIVELVDGNIVYTPNANYNGIDTITLNVEDSDGAVVTKEIMVTVESIDDITITQSDKNIIDEDTTASGNVLSNDYDIDSDLSVDTFNVDGITYNSNEIAYIENIGNITINSNGDYSFIPVQDYNGEVPEIIYTTNTGISDKLNINIEAVNDAPEATDDNKVSGATLLFENHDESVSGDSGYTPDGSAITLSAWIKPALGGSDEIFGAHDGNDHRLYVGVKDSGEVQFGVGDSYIVLTDVILVDEEENHIALTMDGEEANLYLNGELVGTLDYNWEGTSSENINFDVLNSTYDFDGDINRVKIIDGAMNTDEINEIYSVESEGDVWLPNYSITTDEDSSIVVDVLSNDTDIDGDTLSIVEIQGQDVSNGEIVNITNDLGLILGTAQVVDSKIVFTPGELLQAMDDNEAQDVVFDYTISDGDLRDSAEVTINVTGSTDNIAPEATDDNKVSGATLLFENHDESVSGDSGYTPDGSAITLSAWIKPALGGSDEIFGAHDGNDHRLYVGVKDSGEVQFGVGDSYIVLTDVILVDEEENHIALTMDGEEANLYLNGELVGTLDYNWEGTSSENINFDVLNSTYDFDGDINRVKIIDGAMNTDEINEIYSVESEGDVWLPEFLVSTNENTSVTINADLLMSNDVDVDGDELSIVGVEAIENTHGTVQLDENGNILFTPEEDYYGEVSFRYTLSDGDKTDTAIVTLNINSQIKLIDNEDQILNVVKDYSCELDITNTNLIVTLDVSRSMTETDDILNNDAQISKFELAKDALINAIRSYDMQGNVNVNLTFFAATGKNVGWMDGNSAIEYLESLSLTSEEGLYENGVLIDDLNTRGTDYFEAIQNTIGSDLISVESNNTIGIFLSDGEPETNVEYIDSKDDTAIQEWKEFIETNVDELKVIGIGETETSMYLDIMQVQLDTEAIIVNDNIELNQVLLNDIGQEISGTIVDNIDFRDSEFDKVLSIEVDGIVYDINSFPKFGITTSEGGILTLSYETGEYSYVAFPCSFTEDVVETFIVNVLSKNGQTLDMTININVDMEILNEETNGIDLSLTIAETTTNEEYIIENESSSSENQLLEDIENVVDTMAQEGDSTYEYNNMNQALYTNNDATDVVEINRNSNTIMTYGGDDIINVDGNQNKNIDAGEGNNRIDIDGDSGAIFVGDGDDQIRIAGNQNAGIDLEDGNNQIDVHGNAETIYSGNGNDIVNIGGNANKTIGTQGGDDRIIISGVSSEVDLGSGNDFIQVGGNVNQRIEGGLGTDSIVLQNYTKNDWESNIGGIQDKVVNFENIKFSDGEVIGSASAFESTSVNYHTTITVLATQENTDEILSDVVINVPVNVLEVQDAEGNTLAITDSTVNVPVTSGVESSIIFISNEELSQDELNSIEGSVTSTNTDGEANIAIDAVGFDLDDEEGYDIISLEENLNLDFSDDNLDSLSCLDMIDMENTTQNDIVGLSLDDILEMTDENNTLTIMGDDKDNLDIDTTGWEQNAPAVTNADTGITTYEYGNCSGEIITINVDEQINSTGM